MNLQLSQAGKKTFCICCYSLLNTFIICNQFSCRPTHIQHSKRFSSTSQVSQVTFYVSWKEDPRIYLLPCNASNCTLFLWWETCKTKLQRQQLGSLNCCCFSEFGVLRLLICKIITSFLLLSKVSLRDGGVWIFREFVYVHKRI